MSMSIFNSSLPTPEANIFALLKPVKTHYMHIKPGLRSRGKNDTDLAPVSELFFSWTWLRLQLRSSWFLCVWL